jgi:hypothetical protein
MAGLPLLKELHCDGGWYLTGNINSLRVLKDTLTTICIDNFVMVLLLAISWF